MAGGQAQENQYMDTLAAGAGDNGFESGYSPLGTLGTIITMTQGNEIGCDELE